MDAILVSQVRHFNRTVTRRMGVLTDDFLGRGRPLAESRLLFEIGADGADLRDLRQRLALDSGYLSRLLRSLESQGLVTVRASPADGRVRRATLSRKGRRELDALDQRSEAFASGLLAPLAPRQRERLVTAMAEVERFMRAAAVTIEPADPDDAVARSCVETYWRELAERFDGGFDPGPDAFADAGDYRTPGVFLLAWLDGRAVGCGGLRRLDARTAEIKRMWVAADTRGLGIAQRLLDALEAHARASGFTRIRLDTNGSLAEARALYARNGYDEIARYNDNPYAQHWLQKRLAR